MKSPQQALPINPPSRRGLFWRVLAAFAVATAILMLVVLPAEFGIDPTGLGKRTCTCNRRKACTCARTYADPDARSVAFELVRPEAVPPPEGRTSGH